MKYHFAIAILFFSSFLFAQERGVSPLEGGQGGEDGQTYAVVVGISDYQDEGIPDLQYAHKDALAFAGFLQSPAGGSLDEDHLKVLINEKATAAQFAIALDWLWEVAGENDRVIIYFSGHGDVERKSITQPGYLLCWDAPSRVYLAGGAMNVRDLNDVVSTLALQNKAKVILVTDACRAGKLSGSSVGGAQATAANLAKQYANEIKILSCQPDEYSIEGEQWGGGRGAFSYHLLDGLMGLADRNTDQSVNLMEIRGYLEERVPTEVAPESQLPMVVGNGREKLVDVFPEILEQLKEGREGQLQLFTPTETRGIEDEVLETADSNVVEMYAAFRKAIEEKQFLEPATACADFYYEQLRQEPQLERLHSSIRRNYAAALQDEAQQVLNIMLKSGLTETILRNATYSDLYYNYPTYLERAAELLGEGHYMYITLQARERYFKGMLKEKIKDKRKEFQKALDLDPFMSHAMVEMIRSCYALGLDSAEYYFKKAVELNPSWIEPYIAMSQFYTCGSEEENKVEELLSLAEKVDSTAILVWYFKANFYNRQKKYKEAEKWYLKVIEASRGAVCFPCAYHNLGRVYGFTQRYEESIAKYEKAIQLDSSFVLAYLGLGAIYHKTNRFEAAEIQFIKAIQLDSNSSQAIYGLGNVYKDTRRFEEAEVQFKKAIQLDSNYVQAYNNLGKLYRDTRRLKEAEIYLKKAIELDSAHVFAHYNLGHVYKDTRRLKEAEIHLKKAIQLEPTKYTDAYLDLGLLYWENQQYDKASVSYKKILQFDSTNVDAHNGVGLVFLEKGHFLDAEKKFKEAVHYDSTFWIGYSNLGIVYQCLQQWEKAVEMTQKAIDLLPGDGGLYGELAYALSYLPSRNDEATATFERAQRLGPFWPDTYLYWAQFILRSGDRAEESKSKAYDYLRKAFEKGIGKDGVLNLKDLKTRQDFENLRAEPVWIELMKKYFPDQFKDLRIEGMKE